MILNLTIYLLTRENSLLSTEEILFPTLCNSIVHIQIIPSNTENNISTRSLQRLTLPALSISQSCIKIKINLNFHFHTWWCLKRFDEGLKGLHKT